MPDCSIPQYPPTGPCLHWDEAACDYLNLRPPDGCPAHMIWTDTTCECVPDPCDQANFPQPPCSSWNEDECRWDAMTCPPELELDFSDCLCKIPKCGGIEIHPPEEQCCNGTIYYPTGQDCCNGEIIETAQKGCCSGIPYLLESQDCCAGTIFNTSMERCCGEVVQPGTEAAWYDWEITSDPELDDLQLADGTEKEDDLWFEEGGTDVSVSIREPVVTEGGQIQRSNWTCLDPKLDCLTGPVAVTWWVSGISTDPPNGTGTTASFTAQSPGTATITFTATLIATLNENTASGSASGSPAAAPRKVTKTVETTVEETLVPLTYETVFPTPPNRQRRMLGLGEEVRLKLDPAPKKRKVTWAVSGGHGDVDLKKGSATTLTAGDTPGLVNVTATIATKGSKSRLFNAIKPENGLIEKNNIYEYTATPNRLSIGILGDVYIGPDIVNFGNLVFHELFCTPENVNGFYTTIQGPPGTIPTHAPPNHKPGTEWSGSTVYEQRGTYVGSDHLESGNPKSSTEDWTPRTL